MTNLVTYAKKGSSLKTDEADANFKKVAQTKSGAYTVAESDNRDTIEVSASATITLPDAATIVNAADTDDFEVTIKCIAGQTTITCTTGTDTIDGSTSDYYLIGYEFVTLKVNQAGGGYNIIASNVIQPVGLITPYAGTAAPTGFLLCDGSAYDSVTNKEYARLYTAISNTFGGTDGTDFQVPDLRGRTPIALDNLGGSSANVVTNAAADSLGGTEGSDDAVVVTHTHSTDSQGAHTHTVQVAPIHGTGTNYAHGTSTASSLTTLTSSSSGAHTHTASAPAGAVAGTDKNMPPYMALGFIIKY